MCLRRGASDFPTGAVQFCEGIKIVRLAAGGTAQSHYFQKICPCGKFAARAKKEPRKHSVSKALGDNSLSLGELRSTTCCLQTVLLARPVLKPLCCKGLRLRVCVSTTFPTLNAAPNIFKRPCFAHYQTAKFDGAFIHFSMNLCKLRDTSSLTLPLKTTPHLRERKAR